MKRIITCSDGTWNKQDNKDHGVDAPTNVSQLHKLICDFDTNGIEQKAFYDEGVGSRWPHIPGAVFGSGINANIKQAYEFIAENYNPGDEIYLFGFSRGAYTARSVAGLIRNSGLLQKGHINKLSEAFALYRRRDDNSKPDSLEAIGFKKKYCYDDVRIKFIGVWDTVGELGIPIKAFDTINKELLNCCFHDVKLSSFVDYAFHALAIDEHRIPFEPALWEQRDNAKGKQVLEQVWFPGVHSDVGGGYCDHGVSDGSFLWMIDKAKATGLEFHELSAIKPNLADKIHDSMSGLYRISGSVNRKIGNGPDFNEHISASAEERLNADTNGYQSTSNPFLAKFLKNNQPKS